MARSQNGYSANDRSLIASYQVTPTVKMTFRKGNVATVMTFVFRKFDQLVEPLVVPGCWGYAERPIRGSSITLSNHSSGTAGDGNAPKHPLGVPIPKTFTDEQVKKIQHILNYLKTADGHPVVRWGGNYTGRKDGMHFEIIGTPEQVAEVAFKILHPPTKKNPDGGPTGKFPLPKDHYYGLNDGHARSHSGYYAKDKPAIRKIQYEVGVKPDGEFGPKTHDAVIRWRKQYDLQPSGRVSEPVWLQMSRR